MVDQQVIAVEKQIHHDHTDLKTITSDDVAHVETKAAPTVETKV